MVFWQPVFSIWHDDIDNYPEGWRVGFVLLEEVTPLVYDTSDCLFLRRLDCELACKSLNDAQLTLEQALAMPDYKIGELIVRYFGW